MRRIILALLALCGATWCYAEGDDEHVFARIGDVVLTQEMLDAAFSRIPEEHRLGFIRDSKKVDQLVKQILTNMILAEQARAESYDENPMVAGRIRLAENKALTEAWLEERVRRSPDPDYEALAREFYLLNPDQFMTELTFDATHLLIKAEERTAEAARALAEDLRRQTLDDPGSFDRLIQQYSEAQEASRNGGRLAGIKTGQTFEAFEAAALALEQPGQFSDVVETPWGFHIIRLDAVNEPSKIPFDEVRQRLMASQKAAHLEKLRTRIVTEAVSVAPLEFPEGAVENMLMRYFGEDFGIAPAPGR
jgi:peptidyl-prolyl cis-trans isomerase C